MKVEAEIVINKVSKLMEMNRKDFNIDYPLEKYGNWDSLTVISTIALIDEKFSVMLLGCEIEKCITFNDILMTVEQKLGLKAA